MKKILDYGKEFRLKTYFNESFLFSLIRCDKCVLSLEKNWKVTAIDSYSNSLKVFGILEFDKSFFGGLQDSASFESNVQVISNKMVMVRTVVDIGWEVLKKICIRNWGNDGMVFDFGDGSRKVQFIEYYQLFANDKFLLHYSVDSDFFERYVLPSNWSLEMGLQGLEVPKVFDNITYDELDPLLEEMIQIMNIFRKKQDRKGVVKIKRKGD